MAQILRAANEEQIEISAHCFMPDHVYPLASAKSPASNARRFINRARQFAGYAFAQKSQARLWQRYGYDHVLREERRGVLDGQVHHREPCKSWPGRKDRRLPVHRLLNVQHGGNTGRH
jgi:hypothetical protein